MRAVSIYEMAEAPLNIENGKLPIHHIPDPEGVGGCNSDNTLIREKLGWAMKKLMEGLTATYFWIKKQIDKWTSPFMVDQRLRDAKARFSLAHSELLLSEKDAGLLV